MALLYAVTVWKQQQQKTQHNKRCRRRRVGIMKNSYMIMSEDESDALDLHYLLARNRQRKRIWWLIIMGTKQPNPIQSIQEASLVRANGHTMENHSDRKCNHKCNLP